MTLRSQPDTEEAEMSIPWRDRIATLVVASALVVYLLWAVGTLGEVSAGTIAIVVLALGFVASASAVVPGFADLLAGSRPYLVLASLGGLVALVSGIMTIANSSDGTLAVLVIATVALWAAATARHASAHRHGGLAGGLS
jgi:hypothetical protein